MTLAAVIAFAMCFVLGPALCWALLKLPTTGPVLAALVVVAAVAVILALRAQNAAAPLPALAFMWLGWVVVIALLAKAVLRRSADPRLRRWTTVGALLATTLPWFGLATAEMMV